MYMSVKHVAQAHMCAHDCVLMRMLAHIAHAYDTCVYSYVLTSHDTYAYGSHIVMPAHGCIATHRLYTHMRWCMVA